MYDEAGRIVRTVTRSPWTPEDRALMLALALHRRSLCPGCGHPKATAWHPDNEGWFEVAATHTCHGCTAMRPADADGRVVAAEYVVISDVRDYAAKPLPPLPKSNL